MMASFGGRHINLFIRFGLECQNWLDKACHVQTVYNAIDFSYRPSVGTNFYWEIQDSGQRPRYYGIFWWQGYVLNAWETETTFLNPVNFVFTRKSFKTKRSRFCIDFLRWHNVVSSLIFTAWLWRRPRKPQRHIFARKTLPYMSEACDDFSLFWLLRIKCKLLDEIKHIYGQFQTVYRKMAGL